jgi:hypothetical protein
MKNLKNITIPLAVILFLASINFAQAKKEILTNDKIIQMVEIGLDESIIAEKIRQSDCQCQTDTASLAKLKTAKVPNSVIMAMLNAASGNSSPNDGSGNSGKSSENPKENDSGILGKLQEPGIYVVDNGELKLIEPSVFSGTKSNFLLGAVTYGIKKSKVRATVRGKTANMAVSNSKPEFYFVFNPAYQNSGDAMTGLFWGMPATSPNEFVMVQMKVKDSSREAVMGEYGVWSMKTGASEKEIREYSFEKLKPGIYKVIPKENLATGEYCFYFASTVAGLGMAGGKIFDFSISGK